MNTSDYHLGFIGFGHMAKVICRGVENARLIPRSQIHFVQRTQDKSRENQKEFGITATSLENLLKVSNVIILAVRPSQAATVLSKIQEIGIDPKIMVISVMAGIKLSFYQKFLKNPLLRVMPNTASLVALGMSVFTYGSGVSVEFKSISNLLFSSMGSVIETSEEMMDISCAIAGSGPGFVFQLIETMARAGEKEGLSYEKALKMAAQTFHGASKLILSGNLPEKLLAQIATPNGTTEAGLKKMRELHMSENFQSVIHASAMRSYELSKEFS